MKTDSAAPFLPFPSPEKTDPPAGGKGETREIGHRFPTHDSAWKDAADFLLARFGAQAALLAPNEFHELIPGVYPYSVDKYLDLSQLDAFLIHKGMLNEMSPATLEHIAGHCAPAYGNEVFVAFANKETKEANVIGEVHFASFFEALDSFRKAGFPPACPVRSEFRAATTVVVMTTYNRPSYLARSLVSISKLGVPILIVNDGSDSQHREAYRAIYETYPVRVIEMPDNRGLSNALTTGLCYWLADPLVEWISYLQDDTEVRPDLLPMLARFQDPVAQPLLSGRHSPQHRVYFEKMVDGQKLLFKRMSAGTHLHAHRTYWQKLLPIPTAYFAAPKRLADRPGHGADEDWWITQWSPHSIVKQGGYVCVVPGLVRTMVSDRSESTWGGVARHDPPLAV